MKKNLLIIIFFISTHIYTQNFIGGKNNYINSGFSIDVFGGVNNPINDIKSFVKKGNSAGITFRKIINNNLSLDITGNYSSFSVKEELNLSSNNWSSSSISIGPQYKLKFLFLSLGLYGKIGFSFLSVPKGESYFPDTKIIINKFENVNLTSPESHFGINVSVKVLEGIKLVGNFDYSNNLSNKVEYLNRDISSAINEKGRINYDVADQIPFENRSLGFSGMNISIGISFDICGACTHSYSQGLSNSSRIQNPNGETPPLPTQAQDWNSTRSNKTEKGCPKHED